MKYFATISLAGLSAVIDFSGSAAQNFQIDEATIAGIHRALQDKSVTCRQLVETYLDRINAYDHKGPALNAILTLNPKALAEANERDAEYARTGLTGPL